jgi:hypothetical protein
VERRGNHGSGLRNYAKGAVMLGCVGVNVRGLYAGDDQHQKDAQHGYGLCELSFAGLQLCHHRWIFPDVS